MKANSALLSLMALTCGLAVTTAAGAHPLHRHTVVVAPHAVLIPVPRGVRPSPYCAGAGCSGSATATGPRGYTATRSGSAKCADHTCNRSGTVTGPGGRSATFNRSISR